MQPRGWTDLMIDALTPIMIWFMLLSVVLFLLDVRWVYTEVFHNNLRWFSLCFVTLIVTLNRLVARDGQDTSALWIGASVIVVGIYIMALQAYGTGSLAPGFMDGPWAVALHMGIAGMIWIFANRLTHECCIDENPYAGDVGMFRNTATRLQRALQQTQDPKLPRESFFVIKRKKDNSIVRNKLEPWEPDKEFKSSLPEPRQEHAPDRLPKRHPGVSVLYFSIPVLIAFTLGLPVIQHGGWAMVYSGYFYLVVYCLAALTLLMLTSLGGLREFFRSRGTRIPDGLGAFWLGVGIVQIAMVLVAAGAIPRPSMPGLAYVPFHEIDEWSRSNSGFQPLPVVLEAAQIDRQYRVMEYIGHGVLVVIGAIVVFALLRALGLLLLEILRNTQRWPKWLVRLLQWADVILERITRFPSLPKIRRFRRVDRAIATCTRYKNPLADPAYQSNTNAVIGRSYEALCALAYDLGVPREEGETPYEYLDRFPRELGGMRDEARELTEFLVQSQYAGKEFSERSMDRLRKFWQAYEKVRRQVVR